MEHIEKYRKSFESDEHWEIRRNFLLKNWGKFKEDRLLCLAQVYSNMTLLGCSYPKEVAEEVKSLSEGLPPKGQKRPLIDFVKSEDGPCKVQKKSDEISTSQDIRRQDFIPLRPQFSRINASDSPSSSHFNNRPYDSFSGYRDRAHTSFSNNQGFQHPKNNIAFVHSSEAYKNVPCQPSHNPPSKFCYPDHNFVLLEDEQSNPFNTLNRASSFNHVALNFEYTSLNTNPISFKCEVFLGNHLVGEGTGSSKQISREAAALAALDNLRPCVHVVKIKPSMYNDTVSSKNMVAQRDETNSSAGSQIQTDNVGFKLLQLMGWKGGGIGKGEAIPISVTDVYKGQGLGFDQSLNLKRSHIKQFLTDYISSNSTADLIFSSEFTKEERKVIHNIASSLKLKSASKGTEGADRHLIISRKFTPPDLLALLRRSGGSTDKYELIPPSSYH